MWFRKRILDVLNEISLDLAQLTLKYNVLDEHVKKECREYKSEYERIEKAYTKVLIANEKLKEGKDSLKNIAEQLKIVIEKHDMAKEKVECKFLVNGEPHCCQIAFQDDIIEMLKETKATTKKIEDQEFQKLLAVASLSHAVREVIGVGK